MVQENMQTFREKKLYLSRRTKDFGERRMDVHHIDEFAERRLLAHQDCHFLNDIGSVCAIGVTT